MISLLKRITHLEVANTYRSFLKNEGVKKLKIKNDGAAVLVIDPQRSFTQGAWMRSIGAEGELQVKPIQLAFDTCARWIHKNSGRIETMFTRCPFPPGSYDWDDAFTGIIDGNNFTLLNLETVYYTQPPTVSENGSKDSWIMARTYW